MAQELPKNWIETELDRIFNLYYGKGLPVKSFTEEGYNVYGANGIIGKYKNYNFKKQKVIISCRGAASGAIHKTKPKSFVTSNSIILDEISSQHLNLDFAKYAMINADKESVITGTAQPQITVKLLKDLKFPLPPLAEQERIVEKLESLFARLDTIQASLAKMPELLQNFRQQVLSQAVTGKLTEEWIKDKDLANRKDVKFKEISERITVGFVGKMSDKYRADGIPFLRSQNVRAFKYSDKNLLFIDQNFHQQIKKSMLKANDVLIVRSGYPGTTCVAPKELEGVNCSDILILTPKLNILNPHFVSIFMNSNLGKTIVMNGKVGNAQQHFNTKTLKETVISLPDFIEQVEIVNRVQSLFNQVDRIQDKYELLKAKIEQLPQTILHKAFKGELVPQLESDGDARELLEEIEKSKGDLIQKASDRRKKMNDTVRRYSNNEEDLNTAAESESNYKKN